MGSRRDSNGWLVVAGRQRHAKMDHERRNHELLQRLASDTSAAKTARGVMGQPFMSRSLTAELDKGLQVEALPGHDLRGRTRPLKSFQRQTSSSAMKASSTFGENILEARVSRGREPSPSKSRNKRVSSPTRSLNAKNKNNKRGTQQSSDNTKRSGVFERLSKVDSNKSVGRADYPANNRTRDRSPVKSDRRSPLEKNSCSDKHRSGRRPGVRDGSMRLPHRGNIVASPARGDDEAVTEKQEQDNIPETVDKDRHDTPVCLQDETQAPPGTVGSTYTQTERQRQTGSLPQDPHLPQAKVDGRSSGEAVSDLQVTTRSSERLVSDAAHSHKVDKTCRINNTYVKRGHNLQPKMSSKSSSKVEPIKKSCSEKEILARKSGVVEESGVEPGDNIRSTTTTREKSRAPTVVSTSEMIHKLRARVSEGRQEEIRELAVDDDKDVCEADVGEEEEREFYKVSVQTRLVTYNNSTLVIKNTSRSEAAGHTEAHSPLPTTLQTSSAGPVAVAALADVLDDTAHALTRPTEAHQQDAAGELTPARSVRRKLSHYVNKGKSFLSEVYSATQTKLVQYARHESLSSSSSSLVCGGDLPQDSDSGYYSLPPPPLVETNPIWAEDHVQRATSWLQEHGCYPEPVTPDLAASGTQKRASLSHPGIMTGTAGCMGGESHAGGGEGSDITDESQHPSIKVDEEWIKKNILCTCKCRHRRVRGDEAVEDQVVDTSGTCSRPTHVTSGPEPVADDPQAHLPPATEPTSEFISNALKATPEKVGSSECDLTPGEESLPRESDSTGVESECRWSVLEEEEELCYCSCHEEDGEAPLHLLQEVQELLDADHARMWWTITGNFGNILPIDWSKTYTRQQYLPVLNLNEIKDVAAGTREGTDGGTAENEDDEEEEVAQDLDLHHLILNGLTADPVKSAEEVIQEIDDIMQEGSSSEDEGLEESSSSGENTQEPISRPFPAPLYAEKLKNMSVGELNESLMELELVIRQYSETLISQLALRDELEYEKELKNSFISLLLQVQNKRRNFNVEKKKQKKYLTTVIPYDVGHGPPHNPTLQILIKILMAINDDSPTVPTLLTDYILKDLAVQVLSRMGFRECSKYSICLSEEAFYESVVSIMSLWFITKRRAHRWEAAAGRSFLMTR